MLATCLMLFALAQPAPPQVYTLNAPENVWDVAAEDLNQDGIKDILVLSCDGQSYPMKKQLSIYLAKSDGSYSADATSQLSLDPVVGTLLLAEVSDGAPREVLAADSAGVTIYQYADGALSRHDRIEAPSLLPSLVKEPVFLEDAVKDIDGDGVEEWFLPEPTGYEVRAAGSLKAFIPCDVVGEVVRREGMRVSYRLPAYHTFDFGKGPEKGIAFLSDEFADFAYGAGWKETSRFRIPNNLEEKWEASAKMADVDNNGFPDLIVTQTRGTVNLEARTQVYLASAPFKYPDTPSAEFLAKGGIASPLLVDIDGDGRKDMLLIGISFNVRNIISFFVRGKLTVTADVHLFNGTGFPDKPDYSTNLTLEAPEGREQVAYALADFNGDGRVDLAFGEAKDSLVIKLGEADRFVGSKAWAELTVPGFGFIRHTPLNGNPGDDLMLYHPSGSHAKEVHAIVF